ncbi:DNA-binding transcriptional regulator, LysR family [Rhizobiales bacterium GAS188]|nr:DNA-binding transcriptional regulator, LysR family [Rhizobiales bacterium GAS188]
MTLRQLEILRALIRYRTTIAAARQLGLSQPAVSNALKAMETQAGFALFERINNRLFPTREAQALHDEAEAIFTMHGNLENKLRDLRESKAGHLRIVATPPIGYGIIPQALKRFLADRPHVRVFFDVRRYEGVIDGVGNNLAELGFALGLEDHPGIETETVFAGEMVCVVKRDHPLARQNLVTPSDLAAHPFIALERGTRLGEAVRQSFREAGCPFGFAVEVRYCNTACVLAESGVGAAIVDPFSPGHGASHDLAVIPFRPATPAVAFVAWSKTRPLSRLAQAFVAEVRRNAQALQQRLNADRQR